MASTTNSMEIGLGTRQASFGQRGAFLVVWAMKNVNGRAGLHKDVNYCTRAYCLLSIVLGNYNYD